LRVGFSIINTRTDAGLFIQFQQIYTVFVETGNVEELVVQSIKDVTVLTAGIVVKLEELGACMVVVAGAEMADEVLGMAHEVLGMADEVFGMADEVFGMADEVLGIAAGGTVGVVYAGPAADKSFRVVDVVGIGVLSCRERVVLL
jgi:hypothetical protein